MSLTRRECLGGLSLGLAAGVLHVSQARSAPAVAVADPKHPFVYCLNTSTIRGQALGIAREVEIAAAAGYQAIEPWMRDLDKYVGDGGSLRDLGKRIADAGLSVESAIGFAQWIVDDPDLRKAGLEQAKRDMDTLLQIGGKRIAAPPIGAHDKPGPDVLTAAARYRALLELGASLGIVPQVEVWGFSQTLSRLGETVCVAVESQHPQACVLPDVYHLHRGGSGFHGLKLLAGQAVHVFHMNDYPAEPAHDKLSDADRVYPGDGAAPLTSILQDLYANGFRGVLSLELFNRDYWKQDPLAVARTGLEKMRAAVEKSRS